MTPYGRLILWVVIAATAAVYAETASYGFVYDDPRQIEMSRSRFTWSQAPGYFTTDVWDYVNRQTGNYYRPVFLLWLLVNYQLFGLSQPLWHLSTIAMHLAATILLFFLARRLTSDDVTAGIAALLFGLHPAHVEGVAWISGVTEPLAAVLVLGSLLAYLRGRRAASVALFAAAVFAKETAIVLPGLIFLYEWRAAPRERWRPALRAALPYLFVTLIYLGFRLTVLHRFAGPSAWPKREVALTVPLVLARYFKQLAWPAQMALFPDLHGVTQPDWGNFWAPVLLVALILAAGIWIWRRNAAAAFAVALLALPLAPVLDLAAFSRDDFFHDRYLYLPSAGFCLLVALAIRGLWPRRAIWVALPVGAVLAVLTLRENPYWRDNSELARHTMEIAPKSLGAQEFYAGDLVLTERYADALPLLENISTARPDDTELLYTIGLCRYRLGEAKEAEADMLQVLRVRPQHPHARFILGLAEEDQGELGLAETDLRAAIRDRPRASVQYRGYHATLAALLEKKGDLRGALAEYEAELKESPDDQDSFDRAEQLRKRIERAP